MSEVVCAVCGRTVTADENTTTCPSCGAPLALPVQQESAAVSADSAAPAVPAGDPTDTAEVQAIPVAEIAGDGTANASGVQVDMSSASTPSAQDEPEAAAVEVVEVFTPASEAYPASYASADGSQDGAQSYTSADNFEPVAVAYEAVAYDSAPPADAYVPPVPPSSDAEATSATDSDASAASTDAGLESWQTPAVVLDAIGVDTATGDVVEVVEVFTAEPEPAQAAPAPAEPEAPAAAATPAPVETPAPAPVETPAPTPVAEAPAPVAAAPAAVVTAPAPAVAPATTAPSAPATGGIPAAVVALIVLVVLAVVVFLVLVFTGTITF